MLPLFWRSPRRYNRTRSTAALGIGLILLGLNVARARNGIPTNGFTTTLGILALVLGGLELASSVLALPFKLPVFAIVPIVLGVTMLARELIRVRKTGFADVR